MNGRQQLADLISRIQADGDVGPEDLATALINEGVRFSALPQAVDIQSQKQRIDQMVKYASNILRKPGSLVSQSFIQANPEVQAAFEQKFGQRLQDNHYYYLGMQSTGEMIRALSDVPELAAAYSRMTPEQRSTWVSQLRDAWHVFSQAAEAFGLQKP